MAQLPLRRNHARRIAIAAMLCLGLGAASCSSDDAGTGGPSTAGSSSAPGNSSGSPTPSGAPAISPPASKLPSVPAGEEPLGWGPLRKDWDAAAAAVAAMSPEQKAGQVLMPSYAGTDTAEQSALIGELHLAGSIIMGNNVPRTADGLVDTQALAAVTRRLGEAAMSDGRKWPGLVGVDQEGGLVSRLGAPLTEWPTPLSYGAAGSDALASDGGRSLAGELAGLGFTVDFAPDADVTMGPADPTIGSRAMSGNPDAAARLSAAFGQGMLRAGVLPATKHFPGHGSVEADSHHVLPVQNASLEQLNARDWKPFQKAVAAGLPMVMVGHIAVPALEPGVPASLSRPSYAALRGLGFEGVTVTDALNMSAITEQFPGESAAVRAMQAGADLLLMPTDVRAAHAGLLAAVRDGSLPAQRLDEAATRVVAMMIWHARSVTLPVPAGDAPRVSAAVSSAAVTVLEGPCSGPLIAGSVSLTGGSALDRQRFAAAAQRAGVAVGAGPAVALAGYGSGPVAGEVAVALDAPWPLAGSAAPKKIALYGRTPGAFDALLAVLTGKARAPGKLPAAVGPYPEGSGCG